jgi:hypothetical protein
MLVSDERDSFWRFRDDETDHKSSSHIITAMSWAILFVPVSIYVSLFSNEEQHMQQTSFQILCGCLLVFFFFGNITTIILIYLRGRGNSIFLIALQQIKFVPVVTLFFSGLLFHVFNGLARHMFDMAAEWGATTKEMESVEYTLPLFFSEVWDTLKRFWFMYICCVLYSLGWALLYLVGPDYLVWSGWAMIPFVVMIVAHATMPIILNPNAMYGLYYGLKMILCCNSTPTFNSTKYDVKKEIENDDNSITWTEEDDLESSKVFEFQVQSDGLQGETQHTNKSSTSKHTNKSSTSKPTNQAGTSRILRRRKSRDFDTLEHHGESEVERV